MEVLQIQSELAQVLELYRDRRPKRVLEIGTWQGGTLREWMSGDPDLVVSVDLGGFGEIERFWRADECCATVRSLPDVEALHVKRSASLKAAELHLNPSASDRHRALSAGQLALPDEEHEEGIAVYAASGTARPASDGAHCGGSKG